MKEHFNPEEWLPKDEKAASIENSPKRDNSQFMAPYPGQEKPPAGGSANKEQAAVERALAAIEASGTDLTADYARWRDIGYAFCSEFGEGGREYYHRVSRFHPAYNRRECDAQYSSLLKSNGSGITLGTFFHYVKETNLLGHPEPVEGRPAPEGGGRGFDRLSLTEQKGFDRLSLTEQEGFDRLSLTEQKGFDKLSLTEQEGFDKLSLTEQEDFDRLSLTEKEPKLTSQDHNITPSQHHNVTPSQNHNVTPSQDHNVTPSQHHNITPSQHHNITPTQEDFPVFPEGMYAKLPEFLKRVTAPGTSPQERDLLLLGALVSVSACFPKLYGIYDGKKVFPNLYLFVTAPASAGKGRLSLCKELVRPVHLKLREEARLLKAQFASELADFNLAGKDGKEKPGKPPERMLFIPANNSTTGMFQLISDNNGQGLIFETEGDTLSASFKSDYGNFSDGFRKAFHHETISYYRRTDREYVDIESPCLSTVLSGTPRQVATLIPSAENGLFSRFVFYYMQLKPVWKDVFEFDGNSGLDEYFRDLGWKFHELYKTLNQEAPIKVLFTEEQKKRFGKFFSKAQTKYQNLQSEEYIATVRRSGLICFRMCMLFTGLRIMEDGHPAAERSLEDRDFDSVMQMMEVLLRHSSRLYSLLPEEIQLTRKVNKKERFLEALPAKFDRKRYLEIALGLAISDNAADHYVKDFVKSRMLLRDDFNSYINPEKSDEGGEVLEVT